MDLLPPRNPQALQCAITGCNGAVHARGICSKHYRQEWRRGNLAARETVETETEYVKFAASADTAKQLRRTSRVTGKSIAQLVREAVARYLSPDEISR